MTPSLTAERKGLEMTFATIDLSTWSRKERFEHYTKEVPCTYSMTVTLDITSIKRNGKKLFPFLLYCLTKVVNRHPEFRTAFNTNGDLGIYSDMHPCYTVFHKTTETFSNIWTEFSDDYALFLQRYEEDVCKFGNLETFMAKPGLPENNFTVSMIPWVSFDGFNLNIAGFRYLIPIFTFGKYYEKAGQWWIPLAVQVHHAVCDGFHTSRFINELQELINSK